MAIRGSLREASLPDVLQLLALGSKTGCLSVAHRNNFGYIYFDKGRISYASIVNRRDRLGDLLVKNGVITQAQLDTAIEAQRLHRDVRLGELLVAQGALTRDALTAHIRIQIEEAVYFLFTWTEGTFNFEPDAAPDSQDIMVSVNPESLLLEGARRVDEWSLIEKKIPSFDIIFELDLPKLNDTEAQLEAHQRRLIELIDGRRDVTQLIEDSGLVEFEVGKALYGLASAGFVHKIGKSRATESTISDSKVEEHRNLGVAFYKTGMLEEGLREFRRVRDLRPNDQAARFYEGLIQMRQGGFEEAARTFAEAALQPGVRPAVHYNLALALEQLGRFADAGAALEEALRRGGGKDPRVHTSLGVMAMRNGEAETADAALAAARPLYGTRQPAAPWFHYAALAAAMLGDIPRALAVVEEGLAAHPRSSALHNTHAVILERKGSVEAALTALETGLAEDGAMPQLHKNFGDCLYRAGRYDEALDAYRRATALAPELGDDVYLRLGNIHFRRQERDDAIRCWERALQLDPDNAIVRTNLTAIRATA
ncbi:MAG: tetratricopeptide repeat protein [Gemmatimonadaceae bacterium]|nr:tetratricopeptide repeat protein [Gemmatimonadaceae bacterium]